jgi:hypothetical protein
VTCFSRRTFYKARLADRRNFAAGKRSRKRKVQNRLSGEEWIQTGFTAIVKTLKALLRFAFLAGYLGSQIFRSVCGEAASRSSRDFTSFGSDSDYRRPDAALRKKFRLTQSGKGVNRGRVTHRTQKRHFRFIQNNIRSSWNIAEVPPQMTQRASESLVAVLIRVGLLLALAIMLMAENAQAQPASPQSRTGHTTRLQSRIDAASTRTSRTA